MRLDDDLGRAVRAGAGGVSRVRPDGSREVRLPACGDFLREGAEGYDHERDQSVARGRLGLHAGVMRLSTPGREGAQPVPRMKFRWGHQAHGRV